MTEKTVKASQYIIDLARSAKSFIAAAGEESLPDESLMRAAVTFNMLQRRGMIAAVVRNDDTMCKPHDFDDMYRAHAIALIAHNFTYNPPTVRALQADAERRQARLEIALRDMGAASTDAAAQWTSMAISMQRLLTETDAAAKAMAAAKTAMAAAKTAPVQVETQPESPIPPRDSPVVPEALDTSTRAERERVLALAVQMLRECAGLHSTMGRRLEALIEDIKCGARTYP